MYRRSKASPAAVIDIIDGLDAVPRDKAFYPDIRKRYNLKLSRRELEAERAARAKDATISAAATSVSGKRNAPPAER